MLGPAATASSADAQARPASAGIDGVVTDTSLAPIPGASVSLLGSRIHVVTGENGRFRIVALPAGQHVVVVHRLGHVPVSAVLQLADGDTARPSLMLRPIVRALDTMVVSERAYTARMSEFEERRKAGYGHFLTQADIERRHAVFFGDLIRPVLSVRVVTGAGVHVFEEYAHSVRSGCAFTVFLDGVQLPKPTDLNQLSSPNDVAGIEIYSGPATIPVQYNTQGAWCGVILVWTKSG
jgi:hypothetical protein